MPKFKIEWQNENITVTDPGRFNRREVVADYFVFETMVERVVFYRYNRPNIACEAPLPEFTRSDNDVPIAAYPSNAIIEEVDNAAIQG